MKLNEIHYFFPQMSIQNSNLLLNGVKLLFKLCCGATSLTIKHHQNIPPASHSS